MARRTRRQPNTPPPAPETAAPAPSSAWLDWLSQPAVAIGLPLLVVGLITLLSLSGLNRGSLTDAWALTMRRLWGWGTWPVTLLAIAGGAWLVGQRWHGRQVAWHRLFWAEALAFAVLAWLHLPGSGDPLERALAGQGGGLVGYTLAWGPVELVGRGLSVLFWLLVLVVSVFGVLGQTPWGVWRWAQARRQGGAGEQESGGARG